MTVNPFWFGVLMTIVVEIVLVILISIVSSHVRTDEEDEEQEAFNAVMMEAVKTYNEKNKRADRDVDDGK